MQEMNDSNFDINAKAFEISLKAGEIVFNVGEIGQKAYVVVSGEIEIFLPSDEAGQEEHQVNLLSSGEIFGEMALVDGSPRSASARALLDAELIVIPVDIFEYKLEHLKQVDPFMHHLIKIFVSRQRAMLSRFAELRSDTDI